LTTGPGFSLPQLTKGFTQHVFFDAPARAAASQFAIYHDRWKAADAMLRGTAGNLMLVHVVHYYLVFGACQLANGFDGVFTGIATGAEDLNFVFHGSVLLVHSFC
jgi:hypothetical protein